jgi:hypothetical protein
VETLALLDQVDSVLEEYQKFLPLTVRQVFYRLVGQYGYDKTEQAYARLCEMLVRARRAGMISFGAIRDDGTAGGEPQTFADVADFWEGVQSDVEHYSRHRLAGQDVAIELWCEAAGMVPQMQRVAYPFSVPIYSTGGFSSVTVTWEIAKRALLRDVPTVFLHCGDYDPSGESIFTAMAQDARMFVRQLVHAAQVNDDPENAIALGKAMSLEEEQVMEIVTGKRSPELRPVRVALTEDQVYENDLPTAPPKKSDTRSRNWTGETCQLEAMPPELLADTVREAIRSEIDLDVYRREVALEQADRERILRGLELAAEA